MAVDGFFIHFLKEELRDTLNRARLDKVIMATPSSFILHFYKDKRRYFLRIELSTHQQGIYITDQNYEQMPSEKPQFLALFKRFYETMVLTDITQHQNDRVLTLHFEKYDAIYGLQTRSMTYEWMGKHANLILIDQDNMIIDAYKKMYLEGKRTLLPKAHFEYFPSDKEASFTCDLLKYPDVTSLMDHYMGISKLLAEKMIENTISDLSKLTVKPSYVTNKAWHAVDIFPHADTRYFNTLSELLLFVYKDTFVPTENKAHIFIEAMLSKLKRKAFNLEADLKEAYTLLNHQEIAQAIYQSGYPLDGNYSHIEGIDYPLDIRLTLNQNAQYLFSLYHKAKRSIGHIQEQMAQNDTLITYFESLETYAFIAQASDYHDLETELKPYGYSPKKQKVIHKKALNTHHIETLKAYDATFFIGKNSTQNAYLLSQIAHKDDLWFHIKDAPGSHVVVRAADVTEDVIRLAAMLAGYYSKFRYSSSIPINYTKVSNLKRIPKTLGYEVTLKTYKTIFIDIDEQLIQDLTANKL